ncbi:hypothetical protein A0H81_07986 [Grifola frondosa]|uniref:Uncharacterized protein n=1 Tax=Grifola frondosa TaxID=5627 RepID=A0A1C7M746_GRIFR|nr:hypothetical protein A0H81_07986 [Grifola frondosa]
MDTDPSARRFPPLPPSHPHPLPPPPPSISPAIARHGSRSDSGSSTDGSTSVNSQHSGHVGQPSARPNAHFYGQNPYNTPPQRLQNPNATVDVSNTPHHSTRSSQASQATQNHPTNPNVRLAAQFSDYQARSPPSLTSAASRPVGIPHLLSDPSFLI